MVDIDYKHLRSTISFWFILISVAIGILAIIGWLLNVVFITSVFSSYIPMAPSAALFFILIGVLTFVKLNSIHKNRPVKIFNYLLFFLALVCVIIIAEFILGYEWFDIENFLVRNPSQLYGYLLGRMSPMTSFLFLVQISALRLYAKGTDKNKAASSLLVTIGLVISSIFILGYLYGTPLLYGKNVIPPALNTSVAFAFSFAGTLIGFGENYLPLNLFLGNSVRARLMRSQLPIIILVTIFMGWIDSIGHHPSKELLLISFVLTVLMVFLFSFIISKVSRAIGGGVDAAFVKIKQAETLLKESEEKFRSLAEESPNMIFIINKNVHVVYVNKKCVEEMGYSKEEFYDSGFNFMNLIAPEDAEKIRQNYYKRLLGEEQSPYEYTLITKDKKRIYAILAAQMIDYEGGKAMLGIVTDITDRKKFEEELARNELRYRILFENIPVGIAMLDKENRILLINKGFESIFQYTFAEIKGMFIDRLIVPEELLSEANALSSEAQMGDIVKKETIRKRKDGTQVLVQVYGVPITVKDKCIGIYGMYMDITQLKKAESNIKMLARAVESVSECVSITDQNDIIIFVNDSFLSTYGYTKDELVGKHVSILRPHDIPTEMVKDILPETIRGGWKGEVVNRKKDGTIFPVLLSTSVIKDEIGKPIALIGVATDITEVKKTQDELIKTKELAEKSARLKSEFLAQMSHEIRSPMNVTLSFANMLKDEVKDCLTPEMNEYFEGIELAGKRLIRTVDLILNASELQVGTYEPIWGIVNLKDDIFKSIYSEYAVYAKRKGLELSITSAVSDSRIKGDRYSILQIFANLIDNAIKYTKAGKVEVKIDLDENQLLKVTVEDTGIGMSEEFMKRIFQPFMQEDRGYSRKYEGNGLGLSLVKKYCELNEADIKVESQKGKGSKFIITFMKR